MRREIQQRLPDVEERDLKKILYEMVEKGELATEGVRSNRVYSLKSDV